MSTIQLSGPCVGQQGPWTVLEGEEALRWELARLSEHQSATATERNAHGSLCKQSEGKSSDVIIAVIRDLEARGEYPYNSTVQRAVEARLGIDQQPDNASPLSWLVYRSQSLAELLKKQEAGFIIPTREQLEQWAKDKTQLELQSGTRLNRLVQDKQGRWYGLKPKCRNRGFMLEGSTWVRVAVEAKGARQ